MQINSTKNDEPEKILHSSLAGHELRDTFYSNSKKKKGCVFHVVLNSLGLLLQRNSMSISGSTVATKDHVVPISDIIGGRCVRLQRTQRFKSPGGCGVCTPTISDKDRKENEDEDAYLYVFAYILKRNMRNNVRRERTVITLRFRSFDSHEDNMREAEKWYKTLKIHRENYLLEGAARDCRFNIPPKRLLILLNPKSGSGKAKELFHRQVVPVLNEAEIPYDLYVTKHSNFAHEFVKKRDLSMWTEIAAVGGDGLFHEVVNGLFKRVDWENVIENISLGIIPCGSGNGLARSIAHCNEEPYDPKPILGAALTLVGGHSTPMDIVEIELQNKVIYSFLSVGWGLISDIDIESERLRPLGYQRFTIWTLHRLINLRTYRGRISYIPKKEDDTDPVLPHQEVSRSRISLQYSINFQESLNKKYKSNDHINTTDFEDVISLETLANQSFRSRCDSWLSSGSRKSTYYSIAESLYHSISDTSECSDSDCAEDIEDTNNLQHVRLSERKASPLPPPDKWVVEEGEFVMVHAAYQTHLGSDCFFAPQSQLNDGTIHLVIIYGGISRSQLLNFLINMSSGTHLPSPNTEFIKVVRVEAFQLNPHNNNGILTVDGERMKCGPIEARIIPGAVKVMIPKKGH
ncbi:sphingosine kinase 2 [Musca vetustissima]|uniref:sphingosine kinase 2 n=1 Tax=Musca vetustissima TaxID=27455 RepID=UPI002AB64E97|nr:sphingosine kinase 2 [Musca vetustissima]